MCSAPTSRDGAGNAVHTGLVRLAEGDLMLVESKWGPGGRFLHAPINPSFRGRKVAVLSMVGFALMIGEIITVLLLPAPS